MALDACDIVADVEAFPQNLWADASKVGYASAWDDIPP
jgi:hypothetical protein